MLLLTGYSALLYVKEQEHNSFDARQWDVEDAVPYMQGKVCCRVAMRNAARLDSGCFYALGAEPPLSHLR